MPQGVTPVVKPRFLGQTKKGQTTWGLKSRVPVFKTKQYRTDKLWAMCVPMDWVSLCKNHTAKKNEMGI